VASVGIGVAAWRRGSGGWRSNLGIINMAAYRRLAYRKQSALHRGSSAQR